MTSKEVNLFVRALTKPYPGAWCLYNENKLRIFSCSNTKLVFKGKPGKVIYTQGQGPIVICMDKGILLEKYEVEGKTNKYIKNGIILN